MHADLKELEATLEYLSVDTEKSECLWLLTSRDKGWRKDWVEIRVYVQTHDRDEDLSADTMVEMSVGSLLLQFF